MTLREFLDDHKGAFIYVGTKKAAGWLIIGNATAEEVEIAAQNVIKRQIQISKYNINTAEHKLTHATSKSRAKDKETIRKEYARRLKRAQEVLKHWETKSAEAFIDREIIETYERSGYDGYPGIAVLVDGSESNNYWDYLEQQNKYRAGGVYRANRY